MQIILYLGSFVQNDASQDKELNRRIGLATMSFGGKLKGMAFTSKKVSLRLKINGYSAMFYRFFGMELQNHGPYPEPTVLARDPP